ncbi:MAG: flagellar hook-basal body complex protein FliE [Gammaproteobacteria bacterium]
MNEINVNEKIGGIRAFATPADNESVVGASTAADGDFAGLLNSMIDGVNQSQQQAKDMSEAFERGDDVDLAAVMIASQKARLSFQAILQVRNKLIAAYQDIMNMPL